MDIRVGRHLPPHIDIPRAWAEDRRLRLADIGVLVHLRQHGAASPAEIGRRTGAGPEAARTALRRLVDLGYVEHHPHGRPPFHLVPEAMVDDGEVAT
jgi:predicted transcriptional regulator